VTRNFSCFDLPSHCFGTGHDKSFMDTLPGQKVNDRADWSAWRVSSWSFLLVTTCSDVTVCNVGMIMLAAMMTKRQVENMTCRKETC
jgi:hypothetical protein